MKKFLIFCCLIPFLGIAQSNDNQKWDIQNPYDGFKTVEFSTNEGTWMNLDVSPDGKQLVFDMLGDIYLMSAKGGQANCILKGLAWECQPRFSPDGSMISFTSDRNGADNIWIYHLEAEELSQVTNEDFRLLNNAVWTPDGNFLVARKHFTNTRSAGAGEMWMYHKSGGKGLQLTKRKNDQQDAGEPWIAPNGKHVYFSEDMYPGGFFQYNKDPNSQIYIVRRLDRTTGEIDNIITGPGGAVRPVVSHDGKKLAFVRRVRTKTVLFIHDLESGREYPIYTDLSKDQQEAWAIFGVYSNFNFSPNDKFIYIWAKGKIRKINIENGNSEIIPFQANVEQTVASEPLHFKQNTFEEKFSAKALRHTVTSPNRNLIVFHAAGYLYKKKMPSGKPERLTSGTDFEFEPAFSADGKQLVYTTWNDEEMGAIRILNLETGDSKQLTDVPGVYRTPQFSPNGKQLVFTIEKGNSFQGKAYSALAGLYIMDIKRGKTEKIRDGGEYPSFSADGSKVYFQTGGYLFGSLDKGYHSIDLVNREEQKLYHSKYANKFVPSPDGKWLAFNELFKVYITPLTNTGQAIELSGSSTALPITQVAEHAGISIHWSDSETLHWTLGDEYFERSISETFNFVENAKDSIPGPQSNGKKINLIIESDKPSHTIALTNARIITMESDEVIENGTVIIKDNKIEAVGSIITVPKGAQIINCSGKTIMPGIVDVHAHLGSFETGISAQKHWPYWANLAYGVTTTHDPSANTEFTFAQSEAVKAGNMVGPRIFSTGIILYGADGDFRAKINSYEDALGHLQRTKAFGAFSVKSYNQPRRNQRQMVLKAARELEMMVVPEGGSHFFHNMTMVADGHTGIEHNIPVAPLFNDVIQFWSSTSVGYTPTLVVNYGSVSGEYYWYQKTNVWNKNRLLNFTPRSVVDSRSRHRTMIPDEEYLNGHVLSSSSCKELSDNGVKVNLGAHGQLQGLGAHWELWMLKQGGMTELEALKSATINGAYYIGMEDHIGSIKPGKLADLIVIDGNPLENILETEQVELTMINGRIYQSESMKELGPQARDRNAFYWEGVPKALNVDFHECQHNCCMK